MKQFKSQDRILIQRDFKAKMGDGRIENTIGPHGL